MDKSWWDSFKEELIAIGLILMITTFGVFFITAKIVSPKKSTETQLLPTKTQAQVAMDEMAKVLGEQQIEPTRMLTPTMELEIEMASATPTSVLGPEVVEVFYGVGGLYDNEIYRLEINSPRLTWESAKQGSRKLIIDVTLYNKTASSGFSNNLTASIIKDGVIIAPKAALSVSQSAILYPKEKISFQARLSLIEGTDVREIFFEPSGSPATAHLLLP